MTLGGQWWAHFFSANNKTKTTAYLREQKIQNIKNIEEFYESAREIIKEMKKIGFHSFFDSIMFTYVDNKISMLVGDLDIVETLEPTISDNIEGITISLIRIAPYLEMWWILAKDFLYFLLRKQSKGDPDLKNEDLYEIFDDMKERYSCRFD